MVDAPRIGGSQAGQVLTNPLYGTETPTQRGQLSDGTSVSLGSPSTAPPTQDTARPSAIAKFFAAVRDLFADGLRNLQGLFERAPAHTTTAEAQAGSSTPPEKTLKDVRVAPPSGDAQTDAAAAKTAMREITDFALDRREERRFIRGADGALLLPHFKEHAGDHFMGITGPVIAQSDFAAEDGFAYEGSFRAMSVPEEKQAHSARQALSNADAILEAHLGALDRNDEVDGQAVRTAAAKVPQAVCDLLKAVHDGIDASTKTTCDKGTLKEIASINYLALRIITPEITMGYTKWNENNPDAAPNEKSRVKRNCMDAGKLITSIINQAPKEQGKEEVHPSIKEAFEARKEVWGDAFKLFAQEVAARGR